MKSLWFVLMLTTVQVYSMDHDLVVLYRLAQQSECNKSLEQGQRNIAHALVASLERERFSGKFRLASLTPLVDNCAQIPPELMQLTLTNVKKNKHGIVVGGFGPRPLDILTAGRVNVLTKPNCPSCQALEQFLVKQTELHTTHGPRNTLRKKREINDPVSAQAFAAKLAQISHSNTHIQ